MGEMGVVGDRPFPWVPHLTAWQRSYIPSADPRPKRHEREGAASCAAPPADPDREARIRRYARRAAAWLPLFGRGPAEPPPLREPRTCVGCGATDHCRAGGAARGWVTVRADSNSTSDSHCPECVRLYGIPGLEM